MRYVDNKALSEKPEAAGLIAAAEAAASDVAAEGDPTARRKLIDKHQKRWSAFRPLLERSDVGRKCWYTESRNPGSDEDVDHFRPKKGLAERPVDHPGYWWEALNWKNFRLSSHRSNRLRVSEEEGETLGKGEHFPIADEEYRWMGPSEVCCETPLLLDPTDPDDPQLLTFLSNGRTGLAPAFDADEAARERYDQSRRYLHLDWEPIVEDRSALYAVVTRWVERGDIAERRLDGGDDPHEREQLKEAVRELIRMSKPDREYSAAAIAYIRMYKERPWIKRYVMPHMPGEF